MAHEPGNIYGLGFIGSNQGETVYRTVLELLVLFRASVQNVKCSLETSQNIL